MSPEAGSTTVLLVGALLIRLVLTGDYLRYVRGGMGPWLVAAGALLVVLGVTGLVAAVRRRADVPVAVAGAGPGDPGGDGDGDGDGGGGDHDGHDDDSGGHDGHGGGGDHDGHGHGSQRVGWLLLAPVLALLLVTPPALGSFGVDRTAPGVRISSGGALFRPLAAGAEPVPLTLLEFGERAGDRSGASFGPARVRLTGFVAVPADGEGVRLARYQIACCAADAVATVVRVVGLPGATPARDTWLTVVGTYRGTGPDGVPELTVVDAERIPPPVDPYET